MRLVTVGTGTVALTAERSRACQWLEAGPHRLLMDFGSGTAQRLPALGLPWPDVSHLLLTHFHPDHHGDLPTLFQAWKHGMMTPRIAPMTIIGPEGTWALLERLAQAYGDWILAPGWPVTLIEIHPGERLPLGHGTVIEAHPVPHTVESVAYSIERGGRRIVYTGDTGFDAGLAAWARDCDLLLTECSLPATMPVAGHMTPEECAELARLAQPRRLVLTHLYPPVERVDIRGIIQEKFTGPLDVAFDGFEVRIEEDE